MTNPLDGRNTKKQKTKTADFFVNTHISVNFFQKKAKITISFFRRKSKNNNIVVAAVIKSDSRRDEASRQ